MRSLRIAIVMSTVLFACTVHTEFHGILGSTSDEAGADAATPLVPPGLANATGGAVDASVTGDAAATLDFAARLDASSPAPEAGSAADATSCLVQAADYDQTCAVDTDCVNVGEVLECPATECAFCRMETINTRGAERYMAAFAAATAAIPPDAVTCGCPKEGRACCSRGRCQQCFPPLPLRASATASH